MITQNLVARVLDLTRVPGVDAASVLAEESETRTVGTRFQKLENATSSRRLELVLRLFVGTRSASMRTSDMSHDSLKFLVDKTRSMLAFGENDEACGPVDPEDYPGEVVELGIYDRAIDDLTLEDQKEIARRMEGAAFNFDPRIRNLRANQCVKSVGSIFYGSSLGFIGEYRVSDVVCDLYLIAESGAEKQAYWYNFSSRRMSGLPVIEEMGNIAAKNTVRQLGGRRIKTCEAEVVFAPIVASGFLRTVFAAVSGNMICRGESFLCGKLREAVASSLVTVTDDGLLPGRLGTSPFDNEGAVSRRTVVIEKGRLNAYLLDSYSARKLGFRTTGNGGGNLNVIPSNFILEAGGHSPDEIISSVKSGLYVTGLMGFGINLLTGNYSRGAQGIWIENGEFVYPVEEITIAGNLKEMLMDIEMIGNDPGLGFQVASPTLKISRMMIAGE
jgi:PmbA protein